MKPLQTTWDLSPLGKKYNDPSFLSERQHTEKLYKAFSKKWAQNQSYLTDMKTLKQALDEYNNLQALSSREGMYIFLMRQVDTGNALLSAAEKKYTEWAQNLFDTIRFFALSLATIDTKIQKQIAKNTDLFPYHNYLLRIFETARFNVSEKEEKILALKSGVAGYNWSSMIEEKLSYETRMVLTMGKGGARPLQEKSFPELFGLMGSTCSRVRHSAAKAIEDILEKNSFFIEKEFNSILENKKIDDQLRGYERPDQERSMSDSISLDIIDTMTGVVGSYFHISKDFYALKAKLMKKEALNYCDRNAPFGKIHKKYSYEEAVDVVTSAMTTIDPQFAAIHRDMCQSGRVDVFPRTGKRGGAFCMYHGKQEPVYVMLNHTGEIRDVSTLAHEMGHAIHGTLAKREEAINYDTPMFMAEIASTFCESYAFDEIVARSHDREKLALMVQKIGDDISTIHRQVAGYNFERNVHDEFRRLGYLPKEAIGKIFKKHMQSYMGPKVLQNYGAENWWMYWSHFRTPFYVYSYASGLLIAYGMRALLRQHPERWEQVKEFFYTGTSTSPEETFRKMGIDITHDDFWQAGMLEMKRLLAETKKLAKKLGKIE